MPFRAACSVTAAPGEAGSFTHREWWSVKRKLRAENGENRPRLAKKEALILWFGWRSRSGASTANGFDVRSLPTRLDSTSAQIGRYRF